MRTITLPNTVITNTIKYIGNEVSFYRAKTQEINSRGELLEVDDIINSCSYYEIPVELEMEIPITVKLWHSPSFEENRKFYLIPGEGWYTMTNNGYFRSAVGFDPNLGNEGWIEHISPDASQGTGALRYERRLSKVDPLSNIIDLGQDNRGYNFICLLDKYTYPGDGVRILAGCRNINLEDAKLHWANNPEVLPRILMAEQIAIHRGWVKREVLN